MTGAEQAANPDQNHPKLGIVPISTELRIGRLGWTERMSEQNQKGLVPPASAGGNLWTDALGQIPLHEQREIDDLCHTMGKAAS